MIYWLRATPHARSALSVHILTFTKIAELERGVLELHSRKNRITLLIMPSHYAGH